jgi:hypothetical protein
MGLCDRYPAHFGFLLASENRFSATADCLAASDGTPIALVNPTPLGIAVTLTEGAALAILLVYLAKKYPNWKRGDLSRFIDRDQHERHGRSDWQMPSRTPRGAPNKTRGQDAFATSFPRVKKQSAELRSIDGTTQQDKKVLAGLAVG